MANIHNHNQRLAKIGLTRLGKALFVNGIERTAIIGDDEFDDDTGMRRELTASFDNSLKAEINPKDCVVYDGKEYVIGREQETNTLDFYYTVELKHAQNQKCI